MPISRGISRTFRALPTRPMFDIRINVSGMSDKALENRLQKTFSSLDPNAIVRLKVIGQAGAAAAEVLRAESLRRLAPETLNLYGAFHGKTGKSFFVGPYLLAALRLGRTTGRIPVFPNTFGRSSADPALWRLFQI